MRSLKDSPEAFGATLEVLSVYAQPQWEEMLICQNEEDANYWVVSPSCAPIPFDK